MLVNAHTYMFTDYCWWVGNCVGLYNLKFFLLFVLYACLSCGLAGALLYASVLRAFVPPWPPAPPPRRRRRARARARLLVCVLACIPV